MNSTSGQIIDFATSCPWQLYTFSFIHIFAGVYMLFPSSICKYIFPTLTQSCQPSELVMIRLTALSLIYVGFIYTVLTYHSKDNEGNISRLANIGLNRATAMIITVVFVGSDNDAQGGLERSWMHGADLVVTFALTIMLVMRVSKPGVEWAEKKPIKEGLGFNCKFLMLVITLLTLLKFFALGHFVSPKYILIDGVEMTQLAYFLWKYLAVIIFEAWLAFFFSVLFDDDAGHELIVATIIGMTLVIYCGILSIKEYLSEFVSHWMMQKTLILCGACILFIGSGRINYTRGGYQHVN
jgi:hypothetical protein